ncbi:MAG: hypothetical protein ACRD4V_06570 [Candidatus Acidiferrales bacterium]
MRNILSASILFALIIPSAAPRHAQKIVPVGTAVMIRLEQSVNSKDATANQKVKASVAQDVVIHGKVLIPRGSPAAVYVAEAAPAGASTLPKLLVRLDAVTVDGRAYPISANLAGADGKPHESAAGGTSGGAAIAKVGAPALATADKKDTSFEPETVLSFRLKSKVQIH